MELGRFETERVEDFKVAMEQFLEGMIRKQKLVSVPRRMSSPGLALTLRG